MAAELDPSVIPAHDAASDARVQGYDWGDIQAHVDQSTQDAQAAGYTPQEIDTHLGYSPPLQLQTGLRDTLAADPELHNIITPLAQPSTFGGSSPLPEPGKAAGPLTPEIAQHYADAVTNGEVKTPNDFAQSYLDAAGVTNPDHRRVAGADINAQLPSLESTIDHAIGIGYGNGDSLDPKTMRDARSNLLNLWSATGQSPVQTYAQKDPLIHDAVTTPGGIMSADTGGVDGDEWMRGVDKFGDAISHWFADIPNQIVENFGPAEGAPNALKDGLAKAALDPGNMEHAWNIMLGTGVGAIEDLTKMEAKKFGAAFEPNPKPPTPEGETPAPQPKPEEAHTAADTSTAVDKIGNARLQRPPELEPPPGIDVKEIDNGIFDDLHRLNTNNVADKRSLMQMIKSLPDEWKEKDFQEGVSNSVEGRLIDPNAEIPEDHQAFLDAMKPLTDKQASLARSVREKISTLADPDKAFPEIDIRTPEEGYVHRIVEGKEGGQVSPLEGEGLDRDPITGQRQNTLSKFASGAQKRQMYVFDNGEGLRHWGGTPLDELGYKMGQEVEDGTGKWTIKPATMDEVEANTDIKYHRNFIANTVDNVARLARVDRNLDFLTTQAKALEDKGLFVRETPENRISPPPGMRKVDIPQMSGYAVPRIANTLNDFFGRPTDDLDNMLTKAGRFLLQAMFITPFPHALNVAAHWAPARGWDWVSPRGYGRLASTGFKAIREVWTFGPEAQRLLREGNGQILPSVETQNFYKVVQNQLFHTMLHDQHTWGDYVKTVMGPGHAVVDFVKAMYRGSNEAMWLMNDMMLLQRQFELESKGLSAREAIQNAEKDIPNYRVPSEVMGSPALSQFLTSSKYAVFGRYHYGMLRSLALMVRDLAGPSRSASERMKAAGKLTMLGVMGLGAMPLINSGLQQLTGNPNAGLRWAGPLSVLHAVTGLATHQVNWLSAMSSIFSMAPQLQIARAATTNKDIFGNDIVYGQSSLRNQVIQGLEGAANETYPGQMMLNMMKPGGTEKTIGSMLGVNLPFEHTPEQEAKWVKKAKGLAKYHEKHDAIESWVNEHFGQ